ncbi:MAG: hypothetical protein AAB913_03410 [Patescibacteria group bacterium]
MNLKLEQIEKFKELHKDFPEFANYTEDQVIEIANGVANYYLTLLKINQRIKKDKK